MNFKAPIWDNVKNCYEIYINPNVDFEFISNITTPNKTIIYKIIESLAAEGKEWFSSPIKPAIVLKHLIQKYTPAIEISERHMHVYKPRIFILYPGKFELVWDVSIKKNDMIPSEFIEYSEELEDAPAKTIIIQENDILENVEIPFDESQVGSDHLSSRAIFKQKIRHARLKVAIATMNAEKMAEKYFRRYGIQTGIDSESELSFDSEEDSN